MKGTMKMAKFETQNEAMIKCWKNELLEYILKQETVL